MSYSNFIFFRLGRLSSLRRHMLNCENKSKSVLVEGKRRQSVSPSTNKCKRALCETPPIARNLFGGGKIYAEDSEAQLLVKSKFHPTIKPAEFIKLQLTCCN